jgi:hypothetical protein
MIPKDDTPDYQKRASDLQTQVYPRQVLKLHLASFCLANDAITPTIQALLAQAGATMSISNNGCLPMLPPIANWSKGSSLEGPNVEIPLAVHGQALHAQQLAASCVLWGSRRSTIARQQGTRPTHRLSHATQTRHDALCASSGIDSTDATESIYRKKCDGSGTGRRSHKSHRFGRLFDSSQFERVLVAFPACAKCRYATLFVHQTFLPPIGRTSAGFLIDIALLFGTAPSRNHHGIAIVPTHTIAATLV